VKLKADKKIVLAAVKQNGEALQHANEKFRADKEVILTAVKQAGQALQFANKKLKADKKIVLTAVKQNGRALLDVNKKFRADKKIVLIAVKQDGQALQFANKKLKADKKIVLTAVKQNGRALQFANKKLKADKKIVLTAVKQSDSALQFANEKLKEDKEVVRAALKDEELVDKYFQEKLAKTRGKEEVLNQINKCLQTSGDLNEGRAGYASVIEHERETGTFAIFGDDEDEEEVTEIEGYIISENKTGGEVIWNLPDSTDNFLATLEQIEWVTADDEDVKDTITYDDINFSDSRGIGSTAYDTNNKEITEYDEFQGGGDTEVIYLNSTYKPTEITVNFKSKESVIFDNVNSENENYTAKITGETIGVLKNYSDVLMVVRTLLGK
jgi:ribosomal protein L24E